MDGFTRAIKTLEFDKVRASAARFARIEGARLAILELAPDANAQRVRRLLGQTSDARKLTAHKGSPDFGGVRDITDSVGRARLGAVLSIGELLAIARLCRSSRSLTEYYKGNKRFETSIDEIFERLHGNKHLEGRIGAAIVSEEMIADAASPELYDIRRKLRVAGSKVRELLNKYVTGATYSKYLQESLITQRNGRFVVPVKSEYRSEIRGLVHDTSSSGATLFVEPFDVVEMNNQIKVLESAQEAEIERILRELSEECASFGEELLQDYGNVVELAVIFAKGDYALDINGVEPEIASCKGINFTRARHPLLGPKTVVPIDIAVGGEYTTMVITGPNTGGKTIALKTAGLLVLMAQSGLHIPASAGSSMSVFDAVLADIGDEQSIEQSLSTFSSHMTNIVGILAHMTGHSLALFDELGAGTDPVEGAALATAILEEVRLRGVICAATTHYAELKAYALETEGVTNASCEFDVETLKPTYRLITGTPGRSNAFAISAKLGLGADILERADRYVAQERKDFEGVVRKLEADRLEMERERDAAALLRVQAEQKVADVERSLAKKLEEAEKAADKAREEARRILASARGASNLIFDQLEKVKKQQDSKDLARELAASRAEVRRVMREAEAASAKSAPPPIEYNGPARELRKGDAVFLREMNLSGKVMDAPSPDGTVSILAGNIRIQTDVSKVALLEETPLAPAKPEFPKNRNVPADKRVAAVRSEIDLRGQTGDEAWLAADRFIDEAVRGGLTSARLIHGKGTGALRAAILRNLKGDPRVKSFRAGQYGEGDAGVTVVEF